MQEIHMRVRGQIQDQAQVGDILIYHLQPTQRPVYPGQRWLGKITSIHTTMYNKCSYFVGSLEFPGDSEMVYLAQIVGYIAQPGLVFFRPQHITQELDPLI